MRISHLLLLCCVVAFGFFMWGIGPSETYVATMSTYERVKSEVEYLRSPPVLHAKLGSDPKAFMVFTFDDGHESVSRWAIPLLEAHGMRSTQFVIAEKLDDDPWFYVPGYRYHMPLPMVARLHQHGHEIGSHTMTHLRLLGERDRTKVHHEIHDSRSRIAEKLGVPISDITSFAAPEGAYGPDEVVEIHDAGYKYSVTAWGDTPNYLELNPYVIYRYNVGSNNRSTDVCQFIEKAVNLAKNGNESILAVLAFHYIIEGPEQPKNALGMPDTYTISWETMKSIVECVRRMRDAGDLWVGTLTEAVHAYDKAHDKKIAMKGEN